MFKRGSEVKYLTKGHKCRELGVVRAPSPTLTILSLDKKNRINVMICDLKED
jgi:hypothetical protein